MAVSAKVYGNAAKKMLNKEIDWDTDTIKVALLTSSYTPAQATDAYWSDISANEASGTGYTAGGATLASKTIVSATNVTTLDAADVTWSTSTITARYAVVYESTGTPTTSALIAYVDFGADVSSSGGDFKITWDAAGIVTLTAS